MMSDQPGLMAELANFGGVAPLFPLPDFVLFPQVTQPLHIFELRYREMIADTLKGDRLIAIATLKPSWESLYETKTAPVWTDVCLGRVLVDTKQEDGRYLILLRGLCRAKIKAERLTKTPYRQVELELRYDRYPGSPEILRDRRREELMENFAAISPGIDSHREAAEAALRDLPLGVLCDLISSTAKLTSAESLTLLAETNVDLRTDLLLDFLRAQRRNRSEILPRKFPPEFSQN